MNLELYTRAQMAKFAIEEGQRYGGVNNMLAVLHVLRNRVFRGWGTWQNVVDKAPEYRGNLPAGLNINLESSDVRILLTRVDEIHTSADVTDLVGGALFYADANAPMQDWFQREIIGHPEDHPRVAHVGPVWFFK